MSFVDSLATLEREGLISVILDDSGVTFELTDKGRLILG